MINNTLENQIELLKHKIKIEKEKIYDLEQEEDYDDYIDYDYLEDLEFNLKCLEIEIKGLYND